MISAIDSTQFRQDKEALKEEDYLIDIIMNCTGKSHIVFLDKDFNFIRVSESYANTCGYSPDEMIGMNHFTLYPNPPIEAIFAKVRDTGEDYEIQDNPFIFPDQPGRGVTYWDWTLKAVKNKESQVIGFVFSLYETTELKWSGLLGQATGPHKWVVDRG